VARFLARPEVQFTPPRLGSADLHKPVRFEARVTPLLPPKAPLTVDLVLKAGDGPERTARMEADGDRYRLTAVPIPGRSGPLTLRLMARFEDGRLEATTTDRTFKAGSREVALADVRTIWPGSPTRVSLRDGTTITGALSGLDSVPVPVGPQTLSVGLDRAKMVEVKPDGQVDRVACTLVVRQGEKEIYRQSRAVGDAGLLKNPGFEEGLEGWTRNYDDPRRQVTLDATVKREGSQALRVNSPQPSDTVFYQEVKLEPGRWYRLTGWVRTRGLISHGSSTYGTFAVQQSGGVNLVARGPNHGGDTEWTETAVTFQAPAGGLTRICVCFACFGTGTGTVWFDDLNLEEMSPPGEPAPSVSGVMQPNGSVLASLPRVTRPGAVVLAVVPLILYLCSRRRQWWGRLGWSWPLWSPALLIEAIKRGGLAAFRPRFLRLWKPRALEEPFINSDRTRPVSATVHPDAAILALFASGRLRSSEMERLSEHVADCSVCLEVLEQLPEDSMVRLLQEHRSAIEEPGSGRVPGGPGGHPRYQVNSLLGRGGMGLIYLADDLVEGRPVVLKFLREDLLDHPRLVERFRREAAAATLLKHPNIVEAYGTEPFGRWPALVMEYVQGMDLARLIDQKGPVRVHVGCKLIRQAALGLQYSFEQGMVHRDIKPSNLMLGVDGRVKILDFGLAKMQSELSVDIGLTSTGALVGSVDYMSPEQADDPRLADIRADIYSLGCTFYYLLSGAPPFQGMTFEIFEAHQRIEATPLDERRPDVPAALAALVATMMAKEPARRFQTPGEVAHALLPFREAGDEAVASPGASRRRFNRPVPSPGAAQEMGFQPNVASTASRPGPKPRRRWGLALAGALGLVAAVLAGASAYRWDTRKAELVIETDLPNAEVFVTQAGKRVTTVFTGRTRRIELQPGRYDLAFPPGAADLRISRETLTLRPGDRVVASVRRVPAQPDESIGTYLKFLDQVPATFGLFDARSQQYTDVARGIPVDALYDRRPPHDRGPLADKDYLRGMMDSDLSTGISLRSAETRYTLGVLLARHGWRDLAIPTFELAIRGLGEPADALFNLGVVLRAQGLLPDAIIAFRQAVSAQPRAADAHMALGLSLAENLAPGEALSDLRAAVAIRPDDADGWYNLGILLSETDYTRGAIDAFKLAIRIQPEMADYHERLGPVVAKWTCKADAAENSRWEATRLRNLAVVRNDRGIVLANAGKPDEAIAEFRKALRVQPRFAEARANLGAALLGWEDMGAAMAELAEAIRIEPTLAAAHVNLGIALKRQGADRAAVPAFVEAVRLQPDIDTSRRCWARASAPPRSEPTRRFPPLRGIRSRKPDASQ
jgi:tetratricopeptide (TPR) repeat protein